MIKKEKINTGGGVELVVEKNPQERHIQVSINLESKKKCLFHWGVGTQEASSWLIPPQSQWPEGTHPYKNKALQTPFARQKDANQIVMKIEQGAAQYSVINFALFFPDENRWDNNQGKNYHIMLPHPVKTTSLEDAFEQVKNGKEVIFQEFVALDNGVKLACALFKHSDVYEIALLTNITGKLFMHWGVATQSPSEWKLPPQSIAPEGSTVYFTNAMQTLFTESSGINALRFEIAEADAPIGIPFVLYQPDGDKWLKKRGENFYFPIRTPKQTDLPYTHNDVSTAAEEIIQAEMGRNSWTLMHRFNLCHDLLDRVGNAPEGLALLAVWLRFSALRQLDWQRNYNTKPRELSHAQERLTLKIAERYKKSPSQSQRLTRLMLSTLGRGGEGGVGQRIRDEILNIMHRHRIKETTGHFMEEWHQKLHNNTTPDDIVICEAYIAFLKANGNVDAFYQTCQAHGVTRERLRNFERPIVTDPDFVPHLKDALIRDFEFFLKVLKSVHAATDLETAVERLDYTLDNPTGEALQFVMSNKSNPHVLPAELAAKITTVRRRLKRLLAEEVNVWSVRNLLYLDIALEDFLRTALERRAQGEDSIQELIALMEFALINLTLTKESDELVSCASQWQRLQSDHAHDRDWLLHAKSILDRVRRLVGGFIDDYHETLQGKALHLGSAFNADLWRVERFTEEIVRSRPLFAVSMLIRQLEALMRKKADLGDWQIISPASARGQIEYFESLDVLSEQAFDAPILAIVNQIKGEEEPPRGVAAIVTPSPVDILSHVAVRARNYRLLFATCYDQPTIEDLKANRGKQAHLSVTPSGDVNIEIAALAEQPTKQTTLPVASEPPLQTPQDKPSVTTKLSTVPETSVMAESATAPKTSVTTKLSTVPETSVMAESATAPKTSVMAESTTAPETSVTTESTTAPETSVMAESTKTSETSLTEPLAETLLTVKSESVKTIDDTSQTLRRASIELQQVSFDLTEYALPSKQFNKRVVGGKSNNLKCIVDKLPQWICVPPSVALPFGVFEETLKHPSNQAIAEQYANLMLSLDGNVDNSLRLLKDSILQLNPPDELLPALYATMKKEGLDVALNHEEAWTCIKRVWASKWNKRAYLSRKTNGIDHQRLFMAVLIQQVVQADYAFVIHTTNPFTQDKNEIYAEVVLGLGETLVGAQPGRALGYTCSKNTLELQVLSYPDKSSALYGSGLIFRSDSNGEDLENYAGAGLYDSVIASSQKREVVIDYSNEPLLWDDEFRKELLIRIAQIAIEVENACDRKAQDIEGACSNGKFYIVQTRAQV